VNAHALDRELLKLSLSPIAPWVDDPEVTDILVYGSQHVYVRRRGGTFERVGVTWYSDAELMGPIPTLIAMGLSAIALFQPTGNFCRFPCWHLQSARSKAQDPFEARPPPAEVSDSYAIIPNRRQNRMPVRSTCV
jgi:hypothetical protein